MRRYPRNSPERLRGVRTGCPSSVLSCTTWGFSCLVNCSASGELLPRLFTLACALLPKNRRCLFCDTFRRRDFSTAVPAFFTRHVAVWCSDFPPASVATYQRSSAIEGILAQNRKSGSHESRRKWKKRRQGAKQSSFNKLLASWFPDSIPFSCFPDSKWWRHGQKENRDHREGEDQFADHCAEASQQTPPACPASIDHSFAGNEFA
jgi:hypothetical protein